MPIYLIIDGLTLPGSTEYGLPLTTASESFSVVSGSAAKFVPLSIAFPYTAALPFLMHMGALNTQRGATVTFTDFNVEGDEAVYMKYALASATISSFEVIGGSVGMPYISMSLTWQSMQVQTFGVGGGTEAFNF